MRLAGQPAGGAGGGHHRPQHPPGAGRPGGLHLPRGKGEAPLRQRGHGPQGNRILKRKAESNHIDISENCLNIIATKISSNVRELEGALSRVQAFAQLKKQQITEDLVNESLKNLNLSSKPKVTINVIQKKVAKYFNIDIEDLKGKKRSKEIVIPRQIAMFLARELTNASLPKIGKSFGGKDHTTVLHACDKISKQIDINYQINEDIKKLKEEIANI